jgi:tRNA acetyltransferase TAN1
LTDTIKANLNLIVTCARHFEDDTKQEIKNILEELGDSESQITITDLSGILTVQTSADSVDVIKKIRQKLEDEPWSIRYTLRVIPIFQTVNTVVSEIAKSSIEQAKKIKSDETYRITIEKRNSDVSSSEIINNIADKLKNKVSLEKYDWIILVEILGSISGVSVVKEDDVLSVERTKRKSLE